MARVLENRWLSRAGNAAFIIGVAQFGLGLLTDLPIVVIGIALMAAGFVVMVGAYLTHRHLPAPARIRDDVTGDTDAEDLKLVERELAAVISRGEEIAGDAFTEPEWDEMTYWQEATAEFLGAVLGPRARDRLVREHSAETRTELMEKRLSAVREVLDDLGVEHVRVTGEQLLAIVERRREAPVDLPHEIAKRLSEPEPLDDDEDSDDPSPPQSAGGSLGALEREYTEGDRMLKACRPFGLAFLHGPMPTDQDIDEWKRRVLIVLPAAYRHRFNIAPLKSEGVDGVGRTLVFATAQERRLRNHMRELEAILTKTGEQP